jgi:hypothetical protein
VQLLKARRKRSKAEVALRRSDDPQEYATLADVLMDAGEDKEADQVLHHAAWWAATAASLRMHPNTNWSAHAVSRVPSVLRQRWFGTEPSWFGTTGWRWYMTVQPRRVEITAHVHLLNREYFVGCLQLTRGLLGREHYLRDRVRKLILLGYGGMIINEIKVPMGTPKWFSISDDTKSYKSVKLEWPYQ